MTDAPTGDEMIETPTRREALVVWSILIWASLSIWFLPILLH